jgi:hypothetical protein
LCQVVYRQLPNTQGLFRMNLGTSPPSNNTNAKHIIRFVFFSPYISILQIINVHNHHLCLFKILFYTINIHHQLSLCQENIQATGPKRKFRQRSLIGRAKFTLQKQWNKCSNTEKTHNERYRFCTVHGTLFGTWQTHIPVVMPSCHLCTYVVGGFNPSEKYESQLGWFFPIYGKKTCSKPPTKYLL